MPGCHDSCIAARSILADCVYSRGKCWTIHKDYLWSIFAAKFYAVLYQFQGFNGLLPIHAKIGFWGFNPQMGSSINEIPKAHFAIFCLVWAMSPWLLKIRWGSQHYGCFVIFHSFPQEPRGWICTKFRTATGLAELINGDKFFGNRLRSVDSVWVKVCLFPLTKVVAVNTRLALPRSPWRFRKQQHFISLYHVQDLKWSLLRFCTTRYHNNVKCT